MLLAAGRGSRLGALGAALPKPLVPICGYPPIAYGLSLCRDAGLAHVVVNVHHLSEMIEDAVGDGSAFDVHVRFSFERDLLGTGGGLVAARRLFRSEPVLVMNAKVVADVDLKSFISAHAAGGPDVVATMALRPAPAGSAFAPVEVDEAGRVVAIRNARGAYKPVGQVRAMMFTGIHVVTTRLLDRLPRQGESDVIGDAYLPALQMGEVVRFVEVPGYFEEHSTPERYWQGNMALLRKPALISSAPGPLVGADPSCIIHATADLHPPYRICEGALIEAGAVVGPNVVVGAGATVLRNSHLSNTIVWPGVVVDGEVTNAVVTKDDVVPIALNDD
ncbi:MAG: NDP-sugar synthase [Deltaproteobacteria bacterium]|nr:NDP-sugar synthase [Deltaproteobacteria bacterium]